VDAIVAKKKPKVKTVCVSDSPCISDELDQLEAEVADLEAEVDAVFEGKAEESQVEAEAEVEPQETPAEPEPAKPKSLEELSADIVRLVLERVEVKEQASESAKLFRKRIETLDLQVESIARQLQMCGVVERFERNASCPICSADHVWFANSLKEPGETTAEEGELRTEGVAAICLVCQSQIDFGDINAVQRDRNHQVVGCRPVLDAERQLSLVEG
jgi:hypothetical protein